MRRLTALAALALAALLAAPGTATAEPRVGPPLDVSIQVVLGGGATGGEQATLYINGRGCLPQDAPASVMVTVDRFPGQIFTAQPRPNGRWGVQVDLPTPIDGVWVINATCDNYFGTTVYPEAQINADQASYVAAEGGGSFPVPGPMTSAGEDDGTLTTTGGVANTGSHAGSELGIGLLAVALGALLLLIARPRRAVAHARSHAAGRHRR